MLNHHMRSDLISNVQGTTTDSSMKTTAVGIYWNLKVRILQIDGDHLVTPPYHTEDRLVGLYLKMRLLDEVIEM